MLVKFDLFDYTVREYKTQFVVVEDRLCLVNDTMERWRQNNDIVSIVVHTDCERIDMVRLNYLNSVLISHFLSGYLATIVVQTFERFTNTMIQFADFA